MKKHFIILSILTVTILSACTSTKQLTLDKSKITSENSSTERVVSNSQVISSTRVVESQDTSLVLEGHELYGSCKVSNLLSGDTIFSTDANLSLKTWYDSLSKTIQTRATANPQTVSFKYQKITEKQELQTGIVTSTKQEQQKQSIQSVNKDKQITRSSLPWWLIAILIVIVIGASVLAAMKLNHYI